MPNKKGKKRTGSTKKQRRDFLPGLHHFIAALFYFVKLVCFLWDKFSK